MKDEGVFSCKKGYLKVIQNNLSLKTLNKFPKEKEKSKCGDFN